MSPSGCWFQDYAGRLQGVYFGSDPLLSFTPVSLNITAANATGLDSVLWDSYEWDLNAPTGILQLIYVDPNGVLSDAFQTEFPNGSFQPGNSSRKCFTIPTNSRVSMYYSLDPDQPTNTSTLFVGGVDGRVHYLFYNRTTLDWYSDPGYSLDDSWAFGTLAMFDEYTATNPSDAPAISAHGP